MRFRRTTRRALLVALLGTTVAATVWASGGAAQPAAKPIVFPVLGAASFRDDFGDARPQGPHEGIDILAVRHAPVVAAERGKVRIWTTSRRAGCLLYLRARSGTTYIYVHLNNDLTSRNDNRGGCRTGVAYAPGIRTGSTVAAGDLLGFAGDSGDANGAHPHLHFELHPHGGAAVSPYSALRRAQHLLFATPAKVPASFALSLEGVVRSTAASTDGQRLTLAVRAVRLPVGPKVPVSRPVTLTLPPGAVIVRTDAGGRGEATPAAPLPGESATVQTLPFKPTLAAKLAAPGVLKAQTVTLRGK